MSNNTSLDIFNKKRELTHKQRMEALKSFNGLDRLESVDLRIAEISPHAQLRNTTKQMRIDSLEKGEGQKDAGSYSLKVSLRDQDKKRELTHKQRLEALRNFNGSEFVDLRVPEISPHAQLRTSTEQRPNSLKREGLKDANSYSLKVSLCDQTREVTYYDLKPNFLKDLRRLEDTDLHCPDEEQKIEVTNKQRLSPFNCADLRQLLEINESQNNNAAHEASRKIEHTSANSNSKIRWLRNGTEKSADKPIEINETVTKDPMQIKNKRSLNDRMAVIRGRNDLENEKPTKAITETSSENTKKIVAKDPVKIGNKASIDMIKNRLAAIREGRMEGSIKAKIVEKDSVEIPNTAPSLTIKTPFPSKSVLNHRILPIREGNDVATEKPIQILKETSPENTESIAAISETNLETENPTELFKETLSQDTKKEIVLKQHTSLEKFRGLEDFDLIKSLGNNMNNSVEHKIEHTIREPKETSEATKGDILTKDPIKITKTSYSEIITRKGLENVGVQQLFGNIDDNNCEQPISDSFTQTSCLQKELIEEMKKTSSQVTEKKIDSKDLDVKITKKTLLFENIDNNNFEQTISDSIIQSLGLQKELIEHMKNTSPKVIKKKIDSKDLDVKITNKTPQTILENSSKKSNPEEETNNNNDENPLAITTCNPPSAFPKDEVEIIKIKAIKDISDNNNCDSKKASLEKFQSQDEFDSPTTEDMQNKIQAFHDNKMSTVNSTNCDDAQSNKKRNEAESDTLITPFLSKTPNFLGSRKDFSNEKLNSPNSASKDVFFELLQNMNCVITKGGLASVNSSIMPQYVLETWIKDEASSRMHLCQMAVTIRQIMTAISLAEKECANRSNLVNMLEIAVKQNQTLKVVLSATIDTEMFSEYFDGAPILNSPRYYHINKFYLDKSSEVYPKTLTMCDCDNHPAVIHQEVVVLLQYIHKMSGLDGAVLVFLPDREDLVKVQNLMYPSDNVVVHLVHSPLLKDSEQSEIFSKPPPGKRKIILATDIADTFLTIDDLVYVVDSGLQKCDIFNVEKGINVRGLEWISKANANQRAGLTGSVAESYHFSFYTKERYQMFAD